MASYWLTVLSLTSVVTAAFHTNLNYASPSRRHPSLGIDLPKVAKRSSALRARTWDPSALNFTHGVASGDPLPNAVILWTRISPTTKNDASNVTVEGNVPLYNHDTETYIKASSNLVCVEYQIGADKNFSAIVDKGTVYTTSDIDYTVKVEAKNLQPFTQYYYQFNVCGSSNKSPLGRTKTSPGPDDDVTKVGLAVYSCSNYPNGYFNAYGNAARKDNVDYVIHLGDYIYETGKGTLGKDPRATNPSDEIFTLYDRTDLDLLLSHRQYAWIPVWDDHEVSNNGYRDGSSGLNNTEDSFRKDGGVSVDQRKMNAVRAYFEWMPIRQVDMDDNLRIWRTFQIGKLFDLIILDTRNYDRSITTLNWNDDYVAELIDDASRSLMGSHQENWFYGQLSKSAQRGATWRIIGNQIVFSRLNNTARSSDWLNADQDEMPYDQITGAGSVGVEFAGTAVSSSGYAPNITYGNVEAAGLVRDNKELQWTEGYYRGYYELQISSSEITANYFGCPTVAFRNPLEISLANFTVLAGANHLKRSVANGTVENGALQRGSVKQTNLTRNTETGAWNVTHFNQMYIKY
ncbi:hypothetical protein SLS60_001772 [Paraconiothyrium brasiliense]|uniref:Alkaline phosphatase n=1 Tax=Paraconiothyrium brasiliense TaxID=300254 RepID=A0ABR3S1L5_9PLEO